MIAATVTPTFEAEMLAGRGILRAMTEEARSPEGRLLDAIYEVLMTQYVPAHRHEHGLSPSLHGRVHAQGVADGLRQVKALLDARRDLLSPRVRAFGDRCEEMVRKADEAYRAKHPLSPPCDA